MRKIGFLWFWIIAVWVICGFMNFLTSQSNNVYLDDTDTAVKPAILTSLLFSALGPLSMLTHTAAIGTRKHHWQVSCVRHKDRGAPAMYCRHDHAPTVNNIVVPEPDLYNHFNIDLSKP